jgi:hypothetical protein
MADVANSGEPDLQRSNVVNFRPHAAASAGTQRKTDKPTSYHEASNGAARPFAQSRSITKASLRRAVREIALIDFCGLPNCCALLVVRTVVMDNQMASGTLVWRYF